MTIKNKLVGTLAILGSVSALTVGCTADVNEPSVSTNQQTLTADDPANPRNPQVVPQDVADAVDAAALCAERIPACVRKATKPSELVLCNEDYVACVAYILNVDIPDMPASDVIGCAEKAAKCARDATSPQTLATCGPDFVTCAGDAVGVGTTVTAIVKCATDAATCADAAEAGSDALKCAEANAECVANTLDVPLPDLPAGDLAACAEAAARCTLDASRASEIAKCTTDLTSCQAGAVDAFQVVDDVADCNAATVRCVADAADPRALNACAQAQADCVAGALDVILPDLPIADATVCIDKAAECAANATSPRMVAACAQDLNDCFQAQVATTVDCNVAFNQCVLANPFNLPTCAEENQVCLSQ